MKPSSRHPMIKRFLWATNIQPNELKSVILSFLFVFTLMTTYYLLRPIRDAMASDWSDAEVSWLWTINFFVSTVMVAVYGWVVSRVRFKHIVTIAYGFFALIFATFYFLNDSLSSTNLDKLFYLWVSVFALFHVSIFWSFMAETFRKNQATRVFSVIATGASVGAIVGPIISSILVTRIGINSMMLIAAGTILTPIVFAHVLSKLKLSDLGNVSAADEENQGIIGGASLEGFAEFFSNKYLLGIGVLIILYTGIGSFVYLELKNLLVEFSREQRAEIYSYRDLVTNTITFVLGLFVTGRLVPKLGMPISLALVPLVLMVGMILLAVSPVLILALGVWVTRSAGNYGLARPAREMLFTKVSRESRFKTKPVIDIVAYRGGDVIMAWFFTLLTQGIGLGLAAVGLVGAGIAALWAALAWHLGKTFERLPDTRKN